MSSDERKDVVEELKTLNETITTELDNLIKKIEETLKTKEKLKRVGL